MKPMAFTSEILSMWATSVATAEASAAKLSIPPLVKRRMCVGLTPGTSLTYRPGEFTGLEDSARVLGVGLGVGGGYWVQAWVLSWVRSRTSGPPEPLHSYSVFSQPARFWASRPKTPVCSLVCRFHLSCHSPSRIIFCFEPISQLLISFEMSSRK